MARTKTYAQTVAEAEQALIEKTERERPTVADLEAAEAALLAAEDERHVCAEHIESIFSSWRSATDEGAALEEYTLASASLARAEQRREAAKARLAGTERRLAANAGDLTDPALAELVAEVVRVAMPGVPVVSTFLRHPVDPPHAARPIVVVNVNESTEQPDGRREGAVTVTYHRDRDLMHPLDAVRLREIAPEVVGSRGIIRFPTALKNVGVRTTHPTNGSARDVLSLKYVAGYAGPPRLTAVEDGPFVAPSLALTLAKSLADESTPVHAPKPREPHFLAGRFRVAAHSEELLSEKVTGDKRTVTLDATVLVQRDTSGGRDLTRTIDTVVAGLDGRLFAGVGIVKGVERLPERLSPEAAAAFISRHLPSHASAPHGYATVAQVCLRLTIESRTA